MNLQNKKITILGFGKSGQALAELVLGLGGQVKISDKKTQANMPEDLNSWVAEKKIEFEYGGHSASFIRESDLILLSPGVSFYTDVIKEALAKGIPVLGEIEFAFQFCFKPVIAVTGSNGKTTVVNLIHRVLTEAGYKSCLCGNVGTPLAQVVLKTEGVDFVVLEISSFQLESLLDPHNRSSPLIGFKPHVAVLLNFSQNHLDRHKDLEEYFEAKKKIFLNQEARDFAVLNEEDDHLRGLDSSLKSKVVYFNADQSKRLTGRSNPNQAAVMAVAKVLGIREEICRKVFRDFKGVEHRLEWVREVNGVYFINDSKSTTTEATRWALNSIDRPLIMICGGRDKNMDFSVLSELIKLKVKKMITIGEAKKKIKLTFDEFVDVIECDLLETAVDKAQSFASPGDCILLSPMCASYDMFLNFEERGKIFKQIVNRL